MPTPMPIEHVNDALRLDADAEIDLWEINPVTGGTIYVKSDNEMTWLTKKYESVPIALSGESWGSDGKMPTPRLVIGQDGLDLIQIKGLMFDGHLDGATILRKTVLLDNVLNNRNIKQTTTFRVKRVEGYQRSKITLALASFSGAVGRMMPHRQYIPPSFPWVEV